MQYIGQWVMEVLYYSVLVKSFLILRGKSVIFSTFVSDCNWATIVYWIFDEYYEGWNFNSGNYLFTTDTK